MDPVSAALSQNLRNVFVATLSRTNLTPDQKKICQQTSKFLPYVTEFMDKCFSLIDNSSLEQIRQEQSTSDAQMSNEETSINTGIVSCLHSVLHMADPIISEAIIKKLETYLKVEMGDRI